MNRNHFVLMCRSAYFLFQNSLKANQTGIRTRPRCQQAEVLLTPCVLGANFSQNQNRHVPHATIGSTREVFLVRTYLPYREEVVHWVCIRTAP